jgi:inosine-uridine nucleoside N-ribohydrolase
MRKIHFDTDLGGDIDDICALAMLLCWRDVEITGITTVAEANGRRAGYVRRVLAIAGRNNIPVASGADVFQGYYRFPEFGYPDEERYWSQPTVPSPNILDEALELLKQSIDQGATIIAVGPFTNLHLLDRKYPGLLMQAKLFLMGGYIYPIRSGFPNWGNDFDWNIQVDVKSAKHVIENSNPTLIPLTVTVETALRRAHLKDLQKCGALGQLLAQQAEAFAMDEQNEKNYGETCEGLPNDIINFLHDPLACAIAMGWDDGVEIEGVSLILEEKDGWLHEKISPAGKAVRVVTKINGTRFNEFWLDKITNNKRNNL